ncbi:MAG TPA: MATE family efflux transporter, partial [Candidatus Sumerlaeota bacterium]|nr:MATE family efflux transporter [Candidatus Sumerlaeota bacterium]
MNHHAREIRKQFIHLVWPVIIQNFLHMLMFNIDTAMVGRLNPVALASMGIAGPVNWTIMMVAMGLSIGTVATVARSWGEKNQEKAASFAATSYIMGIFMSVVVSACVIPFCFKIGGLFIDEAEVIRESGRYLRIIYVFFIFTNTSLIASSIL